MDSETPPLVELSREQVTLLTAMEPVRDELATRFPTLARAPQFRAVVAKVEQLTKGVEWSNQRIVLLGPAQSGKSATAANLRSVPGFPPLLQSITFVAAHGPKDQDDLSEGSVLRQPSAAVLLFLQIHSLQVDLGICEFVKASSETHPGRVLLVITGIDRLDMKAEGQENKFLGAVERRALSLSIPLEQVHFLTNVPADRLPLEPPKEEAAGSTLQAAFRASLNTGGIHRLRKWLLRLPRIARAPAGLPTDLLAVRDELRGLLEAVLRGDDLNGPLLEQAFVWQAKLRQLAAELRRDDGLPLQEFARAFADTLRGRFEVVCPASYSLEGAQLVAQHKRILPMLLSAGKALLRDQYVPGLFDAVANRLQHLEALDGPLPIRDQSSAVAAWQALAQADSSDLDWLLTRAGDLDGPLFARAPGSPNLSGKDYRHIMSRKFTVVAQQAGEQIVLRMRRHLQELSQEVDRIIDSLGEPDPELKRQAADLLATLR